ncbi:MSC_0621 family F1-like ATPase epsilon subunit [Mycoplasmopsis felifaucium]|uniref:MSC_0621 family F1-like ATPase epsilon subunit n=1 Tax=Mycoplasmopsis felifaucium TaxID=35768 RepID=UPI0004820194|nr:hypothetical protein [Mycoplasmopsis felifaucium]
MSKTILMHFLDNKILKLKKYDLFINHNDENDWIKLPNESICAYPDMLIKLVNEEDKNTFYMFLKNLNIVDNGNSIMVKSFSNIKFYKTSKLKENYKNLIKITKSKISQLEASLYLGLTIDEIIELEALNDKLYELELKQILNLKEVENYE